MSSPGMSHAFNSSQEGEIANRNLHNIDPGSSGSEVFYAQPSSSTRNMFISVESNPVVLPSRNAFFPAQNLKSQFSQQMQQSRDILDGNIRYDANVTMPARGMDQLDRSVRFVTMPSENAFVGNLHNHAVTTTPVSPTHRFVQGSSTSKSIGIGIAEGSHNSRPQRELQNPNIIKSPASGKNSKSPKKSGWSILGLNLKNPSHNGADANAGKSSFTPISNIPPKAAKVLGAQSRSLPTRNRQDTVFTDDSSTSSDGTFLMSSDSHSRSGDAPYLRTVDQGINRGQLDALERAAPPESPTNVPENIGLSKGKGRAYSIDQRSSNRDTPAASPTSKHDAGLDYVLPVMDCDPKAISHDLDETLLPKSLTINTPRSIAGSSDDRSSDSHNASTGNEDCAVQKGQVNEKQLDYILETLLHEIQAIVKAKDNRVKEILKSISVLKQHLNSRMDTDVEYLRVKVDKGISALIAEFPAMRDLLMALLKNLDADKQDLIGHMSKLTTLVEDFVHENGAKDKKTLELFTRVALERKSSGRQVVDALKTIALDKHESDKQMARDLEAFTNDTGDLLQRFTVETAGSQTTLRSDLEALKFEFTTRIEALRTSTEDLKMYMAQKLEMFMADVREKMDELAVEVELRLRASGSTAVADTQSQTDHITQCLKDLFSNQEQILKDQLAITSTAVASLKRDVEDLNKRLERPGLLTDTGTGACPNPPISRGLLLTSTSDIHPALRPSHS